MKYNNHIQLTKRHAIRMHDYYAYQYQKQWGNKFITWQQQQRTMWAKLLKECKS